MIWGIKNRECIIYAFFKHALGSVTVFVSTKRMSGEARHLFYNKLSRGAWQRLL